MVKLVIFFSYQTKIFSYNKFSKFLKKIDSYTLQKIYDRNSKIFEKLAKDGLSHPVIAEARTQWGPCRAKVKRKLLPRHMFWSFWFGDRFFRTNHLLYGRVKPSNRTCTIACILAPEKNKTDTHAHDIILYSREYRISAQIMHPVCNLLSTFEARFHPIIGVRWCQIEHMSVMSTKSYGRKRKRPFFWSGAICMFARCTF